MAYISHKGIIRENLIRKVGNISQLAAIKSYELNTGREKGIQAFDVTTGSGLEFTVLKGKCLDIFRAEYKGINLSFVSKPGLVSPYFYNHNGFDLLRTFQGGLLYTCGLSNVGPACIDEGVEYGAHGRIGYTPAENVSVTCEWKNNDYLMQITGDMKEAALFGENMILRRKISTGLGSKHIKICDVIENQGYEAQYIMLLYHINLGYPLLDEGARFVAPSMEVIPRDDEGKKDLESHHTMSGPIDHYKEQVFFHTCAADKDGNTCAAIINDKIGLGLYIKYNLEKLPRLIQWKSMMSGDYALGIEPANCMVGGRASEKEKGTIKRLEPFQREEFELEIGILDGLEEIAEFTGNIEGLKEKTFSKTVTDNEK